MTSPRRKKQLKSNDEEGQHVQRREWPLLAVPKPTTHSSEERQHVQRREWPLLAARNNRKATTRRDSTSSATNDPSLPCQNPRGQGVTARPAPRQTPPRPKNSPQATTRRDSTSRAATDPSSPCQNPRGRGGTARPATQQTPPHPKNLKSTKRPLSAANGTTDMCCLVGLQHLQDNSMPAANKNVKRERRNLPDSRPQEGRREEDMWVEEEWRERGKKETRTRTHFSISVQTPTVTWPRLLASHTHHVTVLTRVSLLYVFLCVFLHVFLYVFLHVFMCFSTVFICFLTCFFYVFYMFFYVSLHVFTYF
jgi:hypothetical protein